MAQTFLYMFKDEKAHREFACACVPNSVVTQQIGVDRVFSARITGSGTIEFVQSLSGDEALERAVNCYTPVFRNHEIEKYLHQFTMDDIVKACEWNQAKGHPFPVMIRKYLAHKKSNKERLSEELARLERDRAEALANLTARFDNQIADVNKRLREL